MLKYKLGGKYKKTNDTKTKIQKKTREHTKLIYV